MSSDTTIQVKIEFVFFAWLWDDQQFELRW